MRVKMSCANPARVAPISGRKISRAAKITRIFGTNTSVISWIWVSAWKKAMTRPTTSPAIIAGAHMMTVVQRASRPKSRTSRPFMAAPSKMVFRALTLANDWLKKGRQTLPTAAADRRVCWVFEGGERLIGERDAHPDLKARIVVLQRQVAAMHAGKRRRERQAEAGTGRRPRGVEPPEALQRH